MFGAQGVQFIGLQSYKREGFTILSKWDHEGLSQDWLMEGFGPVFIRNLGPLDRPSM